MAFIACHLTVLSQYPTTSITDTDTLLPQLRSKNKKWSTTLRTHADPTKTWAYYKRTAKTSTGSTRYVPLQHLRPPHSDEESERKFLARELPFGPNENRNLCHQLQRWISNTQIYVHMFYVSIVTPQHNREADWFAAIAENVNELKTDLFFTRFGWFGELKHWPPCFGSNFAYTVPDTRP